MEQLREQQQQFINLKQLHKNEKSDMLLHQEELEKRNRQNFETLREKLEIEKNALTDTMAEKNRMIDKLNYELDEMRDNIQVRNSKLLCWGDIHSIEFILGDASSTSIKADCHGKSTRGKV